MAVFPVWHHGVNGQNAGLQGLVHRLPGDNAGGLMLNGTGLHRSDGPQAVDGLPQCVDRPANEFLPNRDIRRTSCALDPGTLMQARLAAQQHNAYAVALQVQGNAPRTRFKFHQFSIDHTVQPINRGNAIANLQDRTAFSAAGSVVILGNLLLENGYNFL